MPRTRAVLNVAEARVADASWLDSTGSSGPVLLASMSVGAQLGAAAQSLMPAARSTRRGIEAHMLWLVDGNSYSLSTQVSPGERVRRDGPKITLG